MACKELVGVVTGYLDGVLSAEDRRRFDAHLAECPYCVSYLEQMRKTIEATGALTAGEIAPDVRAQVLEAFAGWRER